MRAILENVSYYRVIYTLLTRSFAWFALLYFVAGVLVAFNRKPEPIAEET
jgi:hypothetical protein